MAERPTNGGTALLDYDAVVVGGGFGGMYALYKLREAGYTTRLFEAGDDVGGTWYWNRYPGARCDVESIAYSYSFSGQLEQEWEWTEKFAAQPEILRYAQHVADRFRLREHITFSTRVYGADYDEGSSTWLVHTDRAENVRCRYFVTAVGCLSAVRTPDWPGVDTFAGTTYHTGRWPHEGVELGGNRVGVIGTGSSGLQLITAIAAEVAQLYVFQRTPNFSIPARNRALSKTEIAEVKRYYPWRHSVERHSRNGQCQEQAVCGAFDVTDVERDSTYKRRWTLGGNQFIASYTDIMRNADANLTAAEFVGNRIREIVHDPAVAAKLVPTDHPIGTKRICIDTGYYEVYNYEHVDLVDVRSAPIEAITPKGVRTTEADYEVDVLIFATGYDAMTGPLTRMSIRGVDGVQLADVWYAGPRTYLGIAVHGFPNMFVLTGPGSPSVLANMVRSIEQHVDWLVDFLDYLRLNKVTRVEAELSAEDQWVKHVNELADATLYPQANSWYMGSNVPGKPRVFMPYIGGLNMYRRECDEVAAQGYPGFARS